MADEIIEGTKEARQFQIYFSCPVRRTLVQGEADVSEGEADD